VGGGFILMILDLELILPAVPVIVLKILD
jgi:hypothetical protein